MAEFKYILKNIDPDTLVPTGKIEDSQELLVESFAVNSLFDSNKNTANLKVFSLNNDLLNEDKDYRRFSLTGAGAGAMTTGSSILTVDPTKDVVHYGFETGDVKLVYSFTDDIFSDTKKPINHFIENISADRTEIRALTNELTDKDYTTYINAYKNKVETNSFLPDFFLRFNNLEAKAVNISLENTSKGTALLIKLYKPLPGGVALNSIFTVQEIIADNFGFEVEAELLVIPQEFTKLKGPNFNVELDTESATPTEYFNYNELFSYPVTGSNYELLSLFNKTGAQVNVRYDEYSNYIHFSSAEERLRNFKYKLDLIMSYESNVDTIKASGYVSNNASGSVEYYEGLINGIVRNFDHYDSHLYFTSGSTSWPKSNSTKPYTNYSSTHSSGSAWYTNQLVLAEAYDNTNSDNLDGTVPMFLREDSNNEPYMLFLNMIGQHFDNLWVYFKAVSDKYDTDNRLDFGLSKDLVKDAIESFGVKLYENNSTTGNLFSLLVGETPSTGSELITDIVTILSGSNNENLQPVSVDNYQKEVYKRIYHNLPLLTKAKGTERGLRALINCFGIPSSLLQIRQYGGAEIDRKRYLGPYSHTTSSLDKIRLDLTGSFTTGSTLSRYTSVVTERDKYSDDIHTVEVGFNYNDIAENFVKLHLTSSFDIDDYIGDPGDKYNTSYDKLSRLSSMITQDTPSWEDIVLLWKDWDSFWEGDDFFADPKSFIHIIKYFDNSLFRMIKDFVPARSNVNTGIVIQPHSLNRSKAKQVEVQWEEKQYTGSVSISDVTASNAGAFVTGSNTNYDFILKGAVGPVSRSISDDRHTLDGEFSGSNLKVVRNSPNLNTANPFSKTAQPVVKFDITFFNLSEPIPASCNITLVASYLGDVFNVYATGSEDGWIEKTYPTTIAQTSGSFTFDHDYNTYAFFTLQGTSAYYPGGTFEGWFTNPTSSGDTHLITTSSILNIYYSTQNDSGSNYYARFS